MANIDAPMGFNPVGKIGSGPPQKAGSYQITDDVIFQGDAVQIASNTGVLTQAGVGTTNVGVFWGCNFDDSTGKPQFKNQSAAGQASEAFVYDDPYQVFELQGKSGVNSAQTDVGRKADIVVGTGSTTNGVSGMELDTGTFATGADINCTVIGFSGNPARNAVGEAHTLYEVLINEHMYK
tara:strand:- start:44 stop:583 length:540 start_codon:yes stop_codon:yes gene_type:complete